MSLQRVESRASEKDRDLFDAAGLIFRDPGTKSASITFKMRAR